MSQLKPEARAILVQEFLARLCLYRDIVAADRKATAARVDPVDEEVVYGRVLDACFAGIGFAPEQAHVKAATDEALARRQPQLRVSP